MKKTFRKLFFATVLIALMTVMLCFGASALAETGQCGNNVYWNYSYDFGMLYISGSGDTWDYESGESPFYCSEDIAFVSIEDGVTGIGDLMFEGSGLTVVSLPDSLTRIGNGAFYSCINLSHIEIPAGVTNIGESVFVLCGLSNITVDKNNKYFSNDNYGVLFNKNKTELIQYPMFSNTASYMIPSSVTRIRGTAFFFNSLKSITVDKNSKTYSNDNYGVLFNKDKTKLCVFPAFNSCTSYSIADSVTSIVDGAFMGCTRLTSVVIPYGVTNMGELIFLGCTDLKNIVIPNSIKSIGENAFGYCSNLSQVHYIGTSKQWNNITIDGYNQELLSCSIHFCTTKTKKATTTSNGSESIVCSNCSYTYKETIAKANNISLSATKFIYDGKNKTPKVTVKDSKGNTLVKGTDYKVAVASTRKAIGRYTVKVTFMGNYEGSKNLYFYILPGTTSKITATTTTSSVTLKWNKVAGATGYRVFRKVDGKWKEIANTKKRTYTVKKLKTATNYSFAVRPYAVDGKDTILAAAYTQLNTATKCATPTLKVTSSKKGVASLAWTNVAGESGYEVYGSSKKDSGYKKLATTKTNANKATKSKLTSKKTYYFKVRAYKTVGGAKVYSAFSAVKSVKIK